MSRRLGLCFAPGPLAREGFYNAAMLPSMPQRLLITLVCLVGALCWMGALPWLRPMDASTGITLGDAWPGAATASVALLVAGLPVLLGAVIVTATGTPLRGVFVVATALTAVAVAGGGSQGYWWRHEDPAGYSQLLIEALAWWALVWCGLGMLSQLSPKLKRLWLGNRPCPAPAATPSSLLSRNMQGLIAGAIAAGVGGFLCSVMIQDTSGAQIVGSLILAFAIGAMVSQLIVPQSNPALILASPLLVGVIAYSMAMLQGADETTPMFLLRLYADQLPGIVLVLPIHYASAGVLGASLGVGMAQSLDHARSLE